MNEQDARGFDTIASSIFAPIYPVIASQILEKTGKRRGIALDLGSGPAHLGVAVAQQSEFRVVALDRSPMMLRIASERISTANLTNSVIPVLGDVHTIPIEDRSLDLVFSRGSWFFWEDLPQAFREIYRVLAPGGISYIGGGFGNSHLKKKIFTAMKELEPDFERGVQERTKNNTPELICDDLDKAGIRSYELIRDESGFWAVLTK